MNPLTPAMFGLPGGAEWIVIGVVALLIFGRRLPDVARSMGKSIVEFKKGLRDVQDDMEVQSRLESKPSASSDKPASEKQSAVPTSSGPKDSAD